MEPIERPRATARAFLRAPSDLRARLRYRLTLRRLAAVALATLAVAVAVVDRSSTSPAPLTPPTSPQTVDGPALSAAAATDANNRFDLAVGERAIALARPAAPLPLTEGDVVDIVAVQAAAAPPGAIATALGSGRVIAVDDRAVTIAVDHRLVGPIFESRATGTVELALRTEI